METFFHYFFLNVLDNLRHYFVVYFIPCVYTSNEYSCTVYRCMHCSMDIHHLVNPKCLILGYCHSKEESRGRKESRGLSTEGDTKPIRIL